MLRNTRAPDCILDDDAALMARQLLDDILRGKVIGAVALVQYRDGRVRTIRMGSTSPPIFPSTDQ